MPTAAGVHTGAARAEANTNATPNPDANTITITDPGSHGYADPVRSRSVAGQWGTTA